jgi:hypothetical protein
MLIGILWLLLSLGLFMGFVNLVMWLEDLCMNTKLLVNVMIPTVCIFAAALILTIGEGLVHIAAALN